MQTWRMKLEHGGKLRKTGMKKEIRNYTNVKNKASTRRGNEGKQEMKDKRLNDTNVNDKALHGGGDKRKPGKQEWLQTRTEKT